jgi:hypothetical protein
MKQSVIKISLIVLIFGLFQMHCVSVPHLIWPQKDIQQNQLNAPVLEKKVLVASRSSEFKDAIVSKIAATFKDQSVFVKFIGLDLLKEEDGDQYDAVVVINTCMSWSLDRPVNAFLDRYQKQAHIIVLTTSGSGEWMPKMKGRQFAAISAASKMVTVDAVADNIINRVNALPGKE